MDGAHAVIRFLTYLDVRCLLRRNAICILREKLHLHGMKVTLVAKQTQKNIDLRIHWLIYSNYFIIQLFFNCI